MEMENFYKRFCREAFDDNGVLCAFEPVVADNFNFAYDVDVYKRQLYHAERHCRPHRSDGCHKSAMVCP